nr:uncharacterized protein LOC105862778 isoform X5 [Microcebus murinus]
MSGEVAREAVARGKCKSFVDASSGSERVEAKWHCGPGPCWERGPGGVQSWKSQCSLETCGKISCRVPVAGRGAARVGPRLCRTARKQVLAQAGEGLLSRGLSSRSSTSSCSTASATGPWMRRSEPSFHVVRRQWRCDLQ